MNELRTNILAGSHKKRYHVGSDLVSAYRRYEIANKAPPTIDPNAATFVAEDFLSVDDGVVGAEVGESAGASVASGELEVGEDDFRLELDPDPVVDDGVMVELPDGLPEEGDPEVFDGGLPDDGVSASAQWLVTARAAMRNPKVFIVINVVVAVFVVVNLRT